MMISENYLLYFLIEEPDYIFKRHYLNKNDNTLWSPKVHTMEEFVQEHIDIKISDDLADQIKLNYWLFNVLEKHQSKDYKASFDEFYYWGQVLIKDFDDVDLSLKNEAKIFKLD